MRTISECARSSSACSEGVANREKKKYGAGESTAHQNDRKDGGNSKFAFPISNEPLLVSYGPKQRRDVRDARDVNCKTDELQRFERST